jgi:hypothetical protein
MDSKETGAYIVGEQFRDVSTTATRRVPNGQWFGAGCGGFGTVTANVAVVSPTNTIPCANSLTMVGRDVCIVMSTDFAKSTGPILVNGVATTTIAGASGGTIAFPFSDINGNTMASGTVVSVVANGLNNDTVTLAESGPGTSFTIAAVGCKASGPVTFHVLMHPNATVTPPVASPNGATTFFGPVNVN